jgi:hypothetical protein
MRRYLQPITLKEAQRFVRVHHRHHAPPRGWVFGVSLVEAGRVVGVAMVGRPVARHLDTGLAAEVIRLTVLEGHHNAASQLYGGCWRAAVELGYTDLYTYTLQSEPGVSLRAAGWVNEGVAGGGSWDRPNRARADKAPTEPKVRWRKSRPALGPRVRVEGANDDALDPAALAALHLVKLRHLYTANTGRKPGNKTRQTLIRELAQREENA